MAKYTDKQLMDVADEQARRIWRSRARRGKPRLCVTADAFIYLDMTGKDRPVYRSAREAFTALLDMERGK